MAISPALTLPWAHGGCVEQETFVAELKAVSADFDKYCEMIKTVRDGATCPLPIVTWPRPLW